MSEAKYRVAIIGCGNHGEYVARGYAAYPDTEIVAIVEPNPERCKNMGEHFGVGALYPDVEALLRHEVPDIVVAVTPCKYYKEVVLACAEAGVKGIATDKPMAAVLADADEMVEACRARGVVYGGGTMQRAAYEVQEAAQRLHSGEFGLLQGACVRRLGSEISGGGCQAISVLRLLAEAEIEEVMIWGIPAGDMAADMLTPDRDVGWIFSGRFRLDTGLECPVLGSSQGGVEVWSADALVRWDWGAPEIFKGFRADGARQRLEPGFEPQPYAEFVSAAVGAARSFVEAVNRGSEPWVSGHDMRQALEVAIACKHSARLGSVPVKLPLEDRSLRLYPSPYRWEGGDAAGRPLHL